MKRFIAGLTFALTLTATAHAQEYQTVSQLRESVPARWTTKVETKWRDVDIDAEIVTPDVETIPGRLRPSSRAFDAGGKRLGRSR